MKRGVTLVELMMVVSIIAIITIIVLPNYRSNNQYLALQRSAHKLHHDIRRAQEMSMSALYCPTCGAGQVPSGYGIYFRVGDDNYIIYADYLPLPPLLPNERYDIGEEIVSEIDLESGVRIQEIVTSTGPIGVGGTAGINFKSPDPAMNIYDNVTDGQSEITIIIALDSGATKSVVVNEASLIYVLQ